MSLVDPSGREPEETKLRIEVTQHQAEAAANASIAENVRTDLKDLVERVQTDRSAGVAEPLIKEKYKGNFESLEFRRDVAKADAQNLQKVGASLRERLEALEKKIGRSVSVHVERPDALLGKILDSTEESLRGQVSTLESLKPSIPKPSTPPKPPPKEPPKGKPPTAKVVDRNSLRHKLGEFLGKLIGKGAKYVPVAGMAAEATWVLSAPDVEEGTRRGASAVGSGLGAVIGGYLGSFIPIPVLGTWLGAMVGGAVGGTAVYYAGEIFKPAMDFNKVLREFRQRQSP
jgi:hypothetical protein